MDWLTINHSKVKYIFHLGAITSLRNTDKDQIIKLNTGFSKKLWIACSDHKIPLLYASSNLTYGCGKHGFIDDHEIIDKLEPQNELARSKNEFDKWVLKQDSKPPKWFGFKFFNVFGIIPNSGIM